jgi:hypothetical protein
MCREAFGVLGLHPWEFDEYTLQEYIQRRDGYYAHRRDTMHAEFQHFRVVAYWSVYPDLTKAAQSKPMDKIIPDIYEPGPPPKGANWLADMRAKAKARTQNLRTNLKPVNKKRGRSI